GGRLARTQGAGEGGGAGQAPQGAGAEGGDGGGRRRGGERLPHVPHGPAGRSEGEGAGGGCAGPNAQADRRAGEEGERRQRRAGGSDGDRPEARRERGGPDPLGGRLPRVLAPLRDGREDGEGAQARRPAGVRGVPAGGPGGADQAGAQDERAAGAQGDGRVP